MVYKAEEGRTRKVAGGAEMSPSRGQRARDGETWRHGGIFTAGWPVLLPSSPRASQNPLRLAADGNELPRRTLQPAGLTLQNTRLRMLSDSAGE